MNGIDPNLTRPSRWRLAIAFVIPFLLALVAVWTLALPAIDRMWDQKPADWRASDIGGLLISGLALILATVDGVGKARTMLAEHQAIQSAVEDANRRVVLQQRLTRQLGIPLAAIADDVLSPREIKLDGAGISVFLPGLMMADDDWLIALGKVAYVRCRNTHQRAGGFPWEPNKGVIGTCWFGGAPTAVTIPSDVTVEDVFDDPDEAERAFGSLTADEFRRVDHFRCVVAVPILDEVGTAANLDVPIGVLAFDHLHAGDLSEEAIEEIITILQGKTEHLADLIRDQGRMEA